MTLLDSQRLLPVIAVVAISTALLWLGADVFAAARLRARVLSLRLKACAVILIGCGLWWPAHFLAAVDLSGGFFSMPALAIALALVLAGLATASAVAATRRTLPAFAGLATLTLLVAYSHSVVATPGLFRLTMAFGSWGPGLAIFLLATVLVGIALEFKPSRKAFVARGTAALAAAGLITMAASVPSGSPLPWTPEWAEALLLVALVGLTKVMLDTLAQGAALEHEPAVRRTQNAAPTVDNLTQLPTRVYFEDRLAAAATKADANGSRLALLFIDLDGFKPVNDTYGHSIGDLVLEQVGQRLKALSRGKDVVARVGGDEFLLLLTNV